MKTKKVAVLDIGSDAITLVMQDKYTDSYTFRAVQEYDGFYNGEFFDPQGLFKVVSNLISECEKSTFTKVKQILVGVPGEFSAVVTSKVQNDLGINRKVMELDVDALYDLGKPDSGDHVCISASPIYFELDDGTCTITPVGATTKKLKCLMSYVVAEKSFTALFDQIAEELGLSFTYASGIQAEVMYVVPEQLRDEGVILADVGYTTTSVAYAIGDGVAHMLSFSLGAGHIAADISEIKEIPYAHALALVDRINLNIDASDEDEYAVSVGQEIAYYKIKEINEIASARIENIADMIGKAIRNSYYDVSLNTKVLLTGSGISQIPGAREIVARLTSRQVEILAPDILQFNKPKFSQVAGLLVVQQRQLMQKRRTNKFINSIKEIISRRK